MRESCLLLLSTSRRSGTGVYAHALGGGSAAFLRRPL